MSMDDWFSLMSDDDDSPFKLIVSDLLSLGAAAKRGLSPIEYVVLARKVWHTCEVDAVYAVKLIFDPLVQPQFQEESAEDMFCVLVARIDNQGELIDANEGYKTPDFPGIRLAHVVAGSPTGGYEPDPSKPAEYLLAYFDVLGFEKLLLTVGIDEVNRRYSILLEKALMPESEKRQWAKSFAVVQNELVPGLLWLPIHAAYFSDSLMLWVYYHPGHVQEFLSRCSRIFCMALELGMPLRGAVTVGSAIFNKDKNIYLGEPLVEAARLEAKLNWIGVALGVSFKSEKWRVPIPPCEVFPFTPPFKPGGKELFSDFVLDWPRIWRESRLTSAVNYLQSLCSHELPQDLQKRYHDAISFYDLSNQYQHWCIPPGCTVVKP